MFGNEHANHFSPEPFPGTSATVFFGYLIAPYWIDADLRRGGNITWEILVSDGGNTTNQYLSQVSEFIEEQQNTTFVGNWMMMVNYNRIPPFLSVSPDRKNLQFYFICSLYHSRTQPTPSKQYSSLMVQSHIQSSRMSAQRYSGANMPPLVSTLEERTLKITSSTTQRTPTR